MGGMNTDSFKLPDFSVQFCSEFEFVNKYLCTTYEVRPILIFHYLMNQ